MGLYVLAGVSLIALLTQMVVGGDSGPRRVEVAAGRRAPARPTTTAVAASTTLSPTSTVPPLTTAPPGTAPKSPVPTKAFTGGKPAGGGGGGGPAVTFAPTTTPPVECGRNGTDDRCGPLRWDPDPGPNAGINITVDGPRTVAVDETVSYTVRATDPDHLVTGHCTRADFGDSQVTEGACNPPPCENARGVWDTPPKQTGNGEITYQHTFREAGTYTMRFTFHTDKDRCPDPYGSVATESVIVTVTA